MNNLADNTKDGINAAAGLAEKVGINAGGLAEKVNNGISTV